MWWWWYSRASCPRMSVDILGTNCDQCLSMVQCCFTSTETVRFIRMGSQGWLPRLSHSSWTLPLMWIYIYKIHVNIYIYSTQIEHLRQVKLKVVKSNRCQPKPLLVFEAFNTEVTVWVGKNSVKKTSCLAKWSPARSWKPAGVGRWQPEVAMSSTCLAVQHGRWR